MGAVSAHTALHKAAVARVMCACACAMCVIYAHQLRRRQLRLGRVRRLHLLLDAPLYRLRLRLGDLPGETDNGAAAAAAAR